MTAVRQIRPGPCRIWVKMRNPQNEDMFSGLLPKADPEPARDVHRGDHVRDGRRGRRRSGGAPALVADLDNSYELNKQTIRGETRGEIPVFFVPRPPGTAPLHMGPI